MVTPRIEHRTLRREIAKELFLAWGKHRANLNATAREAALDEDADLALAAGEYFARMESAWDGADREVDGDAPLDTPNPDAVIEQALARRRANGVPSKARAGWTKPIVDRDVKPENLPRTRGKVRDG